MLAQLKEIQSRSEENVLECGRLEAQLIESEKRREELSSKAQEAVRQWKTKCKKLEQSFKELKDNSRNNTDKDKWSKGREGILSQQLEVARQQLADALGRLAQQLELQRLESLERPGRERHRSRSPYRSVMMRRRTSGCRSILELQEHRKEEEQRSLLDLQGSVKNLSTARADLAARLTEVVSSKKNLENSLL
ncbi:centrosomal protein of 128 kDa-like [Puntigrus tetrazona]|uniref:centrosomal protein of 128 kDa-like n=1 Tax=Puntigrus tetrazona TaxID=1606681 RepID=UPI001C897966|nr:centrosomal protein of 128 kDa-like [Puntigrus tetrazona]